MKREEVQILNLDEDTAFFRLPERGLLVAILERACRDLLPYSDRPARKQAILWFTADIRNPGASHQFTFNQIVEGLELGYVELVKLEAQIQNAIEYEESKEKNPERAEELMKIAHSTRRLRRTRVG